MKELIQIEPYRVSLVQLILLVFLAGVGWAGYQSLTASVSSLNKTIKTVNNTMIVMGNDRKHDQEMQGRMMADIERHDMQEAAIEKKLAEHDVKINNLEHVYYSASPKPQ